MENVKQICERYRALFLQSQGDLRKLASAWYYVTYSKPVHPKVLAEPILSFPWLVRDYLQVPSRTQVDISRFLGSEIANSAIPFLRDDIGPALIERLNFSFLLGQIIDCDGWEVSGSLAVWLLGPKSDVNIYVPVRDHDLSDSIYGAVTRLFPARLRNGLIKHIGPPFDFTISNVSSTHEAVRNLRSSLLSSPIDLVVVLVLLKWAQVQGIINTSDRTSGKLSAVAFGILCQNILQKVCHKSNSMEKVDKVGLPVAEAERINKIIGFLEGLGPNDYQLLSENLVAVFKFIGYEKDGPFREHLQSITQLCITQESVNQLREHAFRAHQTIAQTLRISSLWEVSYTDAVDGELFIARKRPKLIRRYASATSVFMDKCSILLFEGARSVQDLVYFSLYQLLRRPQHRQNQCYTTQLHSTNIDSDVDKDEFLYQEFFSHAYRQLNQARIHGCEEIFGTPKISIKFGGVYLTHLPRLFIEDGTMTSISKVREALGLAYTKVGDMGTDNFLKSRSRNLTLGLPVEKSEEEKREQALLVSAEEPANCTSKLTIVMNGSDPKFAEIKPVKSKRSSNLAPMVSSFEPFVHNEIQFCGIIKNYGFICKEEMVGYVVSLTLFNSSINSNCEFQIVYDEHLEYRKMNYRPLRWMLIDGRSVDTGSQEGLDYRFALKTTKAVTLEECFAQTDGTLPTIIELIKGGLIKEEMSNSNRIKGLKLIPELRKMEKVHVRSSTTKRYFLPNRNTMLYLLSNNPTLLTGDMTLTLLERLHVLVSTVTEYSDHDPETGILFGREKSEIDIQLSIEWTDFQQGHFIHELIPALWKLGHFFRNLIQG